VRVVNDHQPGWVTPPEDEVNRLRGHAGAVRRWAEAGADLVMGGHIHLPYVLALHEAYAGLPRHAWAVQAGTAVSRRLRNGIDNSINVVRTGDATRGRACTVERWDYAADRGEFAAVAVDRLRFDAGADGR
jgi:hypothetical protein